LPGYLVALDASQPWLCYWMLYSLDILGNELSQDLVEKYQILVFTSCWLCWRENSRCGCIIFIIFVLCRGISTISKLQNSTGGFGGGPGQISHAAVTYAAVNALATIGTKEAYDLIDRLKFLNIKNKFTFSL
jgi:protein farnesyltransferase subunit beta